MLLGTKQIQVGSQDFENIFKGSQYKKSLRTPWVKPFQLFTQVESIVMESK
jgi:hypothetical protein